MRAEIIRGEDKHLICIYGNDGSLCCSYEVDELEEIGFKGCFQRLSLLDKVSLVVVTGAVFYFGWHIIKFLS